MHPLAIKSLIKSPPSIHSPFTFTLKVNAYIVYEHFLSKETPMGPPLKRKFTMEPLHVFIRGSHSPRRLSMLQQYIGASRVCLHFTSKEHSAHKSFLKLVESHWRLEGGREEEDFFCIVRCFPLQGACIFSNVSNARNQRRSQNWHSSSFWETLIIWSMSFDHL